MSLLLNSLLLACVFLTCYGFRYDNELCSKAGEKGTQTHQKFEESIELAPGQRLLHYISTVCQEHGLKLVGLKVWACDYDAKPHVVFGSDHVLIIRTGHLRESGKVYTRSYCAE